MFTCLPIKGTFVYTHMYMIIQTHMNLYVYIFIYFFVHQDRRDTRGAFHDVLSRQAQQKQRRTHQRQLLGKRPLGFAKFHWSLGEIHITPWQKDPKQLGAK